MNFFFIPNNIYTIKFHITFLFYYICYFFWKKKCTIFSSVFSPISKVFRHKISHTFKHVFIYSSISPTDGFFILIFSLTMGLYCGLGMVYKYKKLGVTGIETIPNIEFWRDYPGLIKDGMAYFLSLVRSCLAKGGPPAAAGGGSGGGYSTV